LSNPCKTTESSHNSDVWDYRRNWSTRKDELRQQLLMGIFQFATVRIVEIENDDGQLERREVRSAEDKLVIRAMTQVLQPVLPLHPTCTHVKGHGGLKQAVRDTQEYLAAHPDSFVMKSDVKGYYAHIDHEIVMEQLHYCLPFEPEITQLVWLFLRRTTEFGGNYVEVQRGLPLAASISPLLGGLYLTLMDALFAPEAGIFYRRFMDDWIIMQNKRHGLRKSVKMVYGVLDALGMQTHPDKTFIGNGNKGFDFLGFAICPTGLTVSDAALSRRDKKIATLFEQSASKRRIGLYLARWLGWAVVASAAPALAGTCSSASSESAGWCTCYSYTDGDGDGHVDDTWTSESFFGTPCSITECASVPSRCAFPAPGLDCRDFDAAVNPAAIEICGNGLDDDCNSATSDTCVTAAPTPPPAPVRVPFTPTPLAPLALLLLAGAAASRRSSGKRTHPATLRWAGCGGTASQVGRVSLSSAAR